MPKPVSAASQSGNSSALLTFIVFTPNAVIPLSWPYMPDPVCSEAVPVRPAQEKQVANAAPSQSSCPAPGVSVASGSRCEKAPPRPSGPLRPSSASLRGACHHPPLLPTRICFRIHCHFPPARVPAPRVQGARLLYALRLTPSRCSKMFLEYVIGQTGKILVLGYL